MRGSRAHVVRVGLLFICACSPAPRSNPIPVPVDETLQVDQLAKSMIIVDGHVDVPWRLDKGRDEAGRTTEDVAQPTLSGDFDLVRARAGGLDAPFMSIYVAASYEQGGAKAKADELIDLVDGMVRAHPRGFARAERADDVVRNFEAGLVSLPMGMENGSPLEHDLANVRYFHERGIRYITLAHVEHNHLSDTSSEETPLHGGLSDFGVDVVREMNRVGVMVDVSHISDEAFWDVIRVSSAPVIASHSSCRHFTPEFRRNMTDEMIVAMAERGGVIMINFGSTFVSDDARVSWEARREAIRARAESIGLDPNQPGLDRSPALLDWIEARDRETPVRLATVEDVADHIDHVVRLVGVDHVGFGSDFDGVGPTLPRGLEDVSHYPNLLRVLLERGYDVSQLAKICGQNLLRVWREVEQVAGNATRAG